MPKKTIKHGVKVFAVCCAYSAVLLGFEVYTGAENNVTVNSALAVVLCLLQTAQLTLVRGRTLFTDNWYTTMELASTLFVKYGWQFCGTMVQTDKKGRSGDDVPFNKLSQDALREVPRCWFHEAILWKKMSTGNKYAIQATTWRDKKQVLFLHTTNVG